MKNNLGADIRTARNDANLTLRLVAGALGRTAEWLRRIEYGILAVRPEKAQRILDTIAQLKKIHSTMQSQVKAIEPIPPRVRKDIVARELAGGKR